MEIKVKKEKEPELKLKKEAQVTVHKKNPILSAKEKKAAFTSKPVADLLGQRKKKEGAEKGKQPKQGREALFEKQKEKKKQSGKEAAIRGAAEDRKQNGKAKSTVSVPGTLQPDQMKQGVAPNSQPSAGFQAKEQYRREQAAKLAETKKSSLAKQTAIKGVRRGEAAILTQLEGGEEVNDSLYVMGTATKPAEKLWKDRNYRKADKDRTEVNWIGVTLIGNEDDCSWDIRPLGTYLYEGMSGLAIFFNALYTVDPQKEYLIICNAIEKELFTYTDEMCERNEGIENESSGAFGGEASIMYTYEVLYKITNKEKYLDYAKKHYKILKKAITRDNSFDLVYGNAGAVITLINMYQLTGNKEYIASAEIAGDIIVNAQEKEGSIKGGWNGDGRTSPLAGFSHGASGIVLALAKLWQVTQKEEYLLSLLDGIKFENSLFVKEKGNWKDERVYAGEKASDGGSFTVAWCHGAAGILLSRSKVNVILNGRYSDLIENDIKVAVNTILKEGILGNNCLCHGNLGNTEILFEYLKDHSDKKIEKYYVDIRDIIAENVCNGVFDCDNAYLYGYKLQGFMTGLCGMGYSLLRDIKKDLPCVIALEV